MFVMVSVTVVMRGGSNNQEDGRATWERSMDVSLVESKQRTTCLEKKELRSRNYEDEKKKKMEGFKAQ